MYIYMFICLYVYMFVYVREYIHIYMSSLKPGHTVSFHNFK